MSEVHNYYFDVGNTRIKLWYCEQDGSVVAEASISHEGQFSEALTRLPEVFNAKPIEILGASVLSPEQNTSFTQACDEKWSLLPRFAHTQREQFGLVNAYGDAYERLGVDRWLVMLGCTQKGAKTGGAVCVVDCGTAITADILSSDGVHEGGYIVPGLTMMRESVVKHTARVKYAPLRSIDLSPGKNTAEAVEHGAMLAVVGLVERLASSHDAEVVLTGGDATELSLVLQCRHRVEPYLLLMGLQRYFSDTGIKSQ
jgi:type III pantothenate kinase